MIWRWIGLYIAVGLVVEAFYRGAENADRMYEQAGIPKPRRTRGDGLIGALLWPTGLVLVTVRGFYLLVAELLSGGDAQ